MDKGRSLVNTTKAHTTSRVVQSSNETRAVSQTKARRLGEAIWLGSSKSSGPPAKLVEPTMEWISLPEKSLRIQAGVGTVTVPASSQQVGQQIQNRSLATLDLLMVVHCLNCSPNKWDEEKSRISPSFDWLAGGRAPIGFRYSGRLGVPVRQRVFLRKLLPDFCVGGTRKLGQ
ncbi:hypothetical protein PVAG01_04773 [Phlyctema vagabunda]|uniref:Uncharacterized protein n=1 Tax=Phlyctema vagabunda TaxID=108571 RepID=A0ABR4PI63_9HELO